MFTPGTYVYDDGIKTFTVVISADGVLVSLDAPKAMTLEDFFNSENWTAAGT